MLRGTAALVTQGMRVDGISSPAMAAGCAKLRE
jgi:hypothetical protein